MYQSDLSMILRRDDDMMTSGLGIGIDIEIGIGIGNGNGKIIGTDWQSLALERMLHGTVPVHTSHLSGRHCDGIILAKTAAWVVAEVLSFVVLLCYRYGRFLLLSILVFCKQAVPTDCCVGWVWQVQTAL